MQQQILSGKVSLPEAGRRKRSRTKWVTCTQSYGQKTWQTVVLPGGATGTPPRDQTSTTTIDAQGCQQPPVSCEYTCEKNYNVIVFKLLFDLRGAYCPSKERSAEIQSRARPIIPSFSTMNQIYPVVQWRIVCTFLRNPT